MNENENQNQFDEALEFPIEQQETQVEAQEPLFSQEVPAAPQPSRRALKAEAKRNRKEKAKSVPVRRVGTFTLGIALIITGVTIALSFAFPSFDFLAVMKLSPLVLVALGLEILWANARKGEARLKYDFLSGFVCLVLICGSACAAMIPIVWKYYGPDRSLQEAKLQQEVEQNLFEQIPTGLVEQCNVYVDLGMAEVPTVEEVMNKGHMTVDITLTGSFESKEQFAQDCAQILPVLKANGFNHASFLAEDNENRWELYVNGLFQFNAAAEQLANRVTRYVVYSSENGDKMWLTEEDAAHQKELEEKNQVLAEMKGQALWEGYSQGYQDGVNGEEMKPQEELIGANEW